MKIFQNKEQNLKFKMSWSYSEKTLRKKIEICVELHLVQGCNQIKSSSECPSSA